MAPASDLVVPRARRAIRWAIRRPILVAALALALASPATADEGRWYGWQLLASDVAFDGLFIATARGSDVVLAAVAASAAGAVLGGPAIHLLHQRYVRSAVSVGARLAGAGLSLAIAVDCCETNPTASKVLRLIVPLVLVQAADIALAREPATPPPAGLGFLPVPVPAEDGVLFVWGATL